VSASFSGFSFGFTLGNVSFASGSSGLLGDFGGLLDGVGTITFKSSLID